MDYQVGDKVIVKKGRVPATVTKAGKDAKGKHKLIECKHDENKSTYEYWVDEIEHA